MTLASSRGSRVRRLARCFPPKSRNRRPAAARVFEEANDALGFDLRALCFDGPKEELDRTANTQPALLATSLAALRAAQEAGAIGEPAIVLGHSLGEFTAIVAASALTLA